MLTAPAGAERAPTPTRRRRSRSPARAPRARRLGTWPNNARWPVVPGLGQNEIVAVHSLLGAVRHPLQHPGGLKALDPDDLGGRIVDDPLADHLGIADHLNSVAGRELPLNAGDPDREQAGAALAQHPRRALVDDDPSPARLRVAEPQLEARGPLRVWRKPGADPLASGGRREAPRLGPVADHDRDPRGARHLRRRHLAPHASGAEG